MTRPRPGIGSELLPVFLVLMSLAATFSLVVSVHRRAAQCKEVKVSPPALVVASEPPRPVPDETPTPKPKRRRSPPPPPAPPPPPQEDPTAKSLARLSAAEADEILAARKADRHAMALETARQAAIARSERSRRQVAIVLSQVDDLTKKAEKRENETAALLLERDVLSRERDAAKAALVKAQTRSTYTILPHKGPNGTWRRPIVVECRNGSVTLQPHGPTFSLLDLSGLMSLRSSPIVAAVARELVRSEGKSTPDGAPSVPYIYFIVRPDGVLPYYAARARLEPLGIAFGYELVDQDWDIDFDAIDDHGEGEGVIARPEHDGDLPAGNHNGLANVGAGSSRPKDDSVDAFVWPTRPTGGGPGGSGVRTAKIIIPGQRNGGVSSAGRGGGAAGTGSPSGVGGTLPEGHNGGLSFSGDRSQAPGSGGGGSRELASGHGTEEGEQAGPFGANASGANDRGGPGSGAAGGLEAPGAFPLAVGGPRSMGSSSPSGSNSGGGAAAGGSLLLSQSGDGNAPPRVNGLGAGGLESSADNKSTSGGAGAASSSVDPLDFMPGSPGASGTAGERIALFPSSSGTHDGAASSNTAGVQGSLAGQSSGAAPGGTSKDSSTGTAGSSDADSQTSQADADSSNRRAPSDESLSAHGNSSASGGAGDPGALTRLGLEPPSDHDIGTDQRLAARGESRSRWKRPERVQVPFEIVVACGRNGLVIHPGGYRLALSTMKAKKEMLAKQLDSVVKLREQVDPLIRPVPSVRFLVEAGGAETYWEACRQTTLSGLDWPVTLQVADTNVLGHAPRLETTR